MWKRLALSAGYAIAVSAASSGMSQSTAAFGQSIPFAGLAPPQELEVLAPLIGSWNLSEKGPPSRRFTTGFTSIGETKTQWAHNRHFIRSEGFLIRTTDGKKFRVEFTVLMGYDREKGVYRRWLFTSEGFASESEGRWDASTSTMTWKPVNIPPNTTAAIKHVQKKDRYEFDLLFKDNDGTIIFALTATAERQKPSDK